MATYNQGINGSFSGKAGSVIGSNWRSIGYMRGLPRFKTKSNSPLQMAQRARFGMAVSFLQPMKDLLNIGFNDKLKGKSTGYNQAMRNFMSNAIIGEYPSYEIEFSKVEISRGSLEKLIGIEVDEVTPGTFTFNWVSHSNGMSAFDDDQLVLLLYNKTEEIFTTYREAVRGDESLELEMPTAFSGNEFHIYVFALTRDGKRASASQYVGNISLS